jgi:hypothetical protein
MGVQGEKTVYRFVSKLGIFCLFNEGLAGVAGSICVLAQRTKIALPLARHKIADSLRAFEEE